MIFFLIGILLTQLLYVLGNWRQHRSRDYLRYALYISLFVLYILVLFPEEVIRGKLIPVNYADFALILKRTLPFLIYLAYFRFMDVFLELKLRFPQLHRRVIHSQLLLVLFTVVIGLMAVFGYSNTGLGNWCYYGFSLIVFILCAWFIFIAYQTKIPECRILLRGSICLAVGAFITNMMNLYYVNTGSGPSLYPDYIPFFIGIVLELFFFNLAMAKKLVLQQEELAITQDKVIGQLRQNEQLIIDRQETRNKIARDLHDELGSTLSGVALFSELSLRSIGRQQFQEVDTFLRRISSECTAMTDKMNDIVWTTWSESDSVAKVLNRLHSYAKSLCSSRNIRLDFSMNETMENASLSPATRNHLYLFSKEAINNAVKYANADSIWFSATLMNHQCTISIKDNGIGFNQNENYDGNGLKNMEARALELGARFKLISAPGKGTAITLQFYTNDQ